MTRELLFIALPIALLTASCASETTKEENKEVAKTDSTEVTTDSEESTSESFDESQYDKKFLKDFIPMAESMKMTLKNGYIELKGQRIDFPKEPALNKTITLTGEKEGNNYELKLTRTNYTNVEYELKTWNIQDGTESRTNGTAILSSSFFLASEVDEDENGEAYPSYDFNDEIKGEWRIIRIAPDLDEKGKNRAKFTWGFKEDDTPMISVEDAPVLRSK